jgi:hypothetical protein
MTGTTAITGAVGTAGAMDTAVGTAGRQGGMGIGGAPRAPGSSIWSRPRCSSPRRISWCGRPPGI